MAVEEGAYRLYVRYKRSTASDWEWTGHIYTYVKVNSEQKSTQGRRLYYDGTYYSDAISYAQHNLGIANVPLVTPQIFSFGYNESQFNAGWTYRVNVLGDMAVNTAYDELVQLTTSDAIVSEVSFYSDFHEIHYSGSVYEGGSSGVPITLTCKYRLGASYMVITVPFFEYVSGTDKLYSYGFYTYTFNYNNYGTIDVSAGSLADQTIKAALESIGPYTPITDPYEAGGGESVAGGGTGTFSETGDTVGIPGLPTLSAVDTGFITLFNPSAAQVKALASYMWSASFDLATFKNIVANPIDCILGLTIVPVDPPNAGSKTVSVGNIPTDVTLPYLSSQYVEVDCGTLNVQEFWGSYLDYSPYTKMSLYLPYIGIIPLDIDDVMNASIAIKYHVDVLSGACVAYVLCNGTQLYTYVGQCSSNVPITSNDFTNTVNGILGIAGSIGKLAADGGASAPTEAAGIAANAINALKPNIQKSGAMSGTGGLMGVQTPYLICQRPRQSVPAKQNSFTGYPANITAKLSDLSGYTEVESIHLDGLSATQEEQQEIMDLLTSGVII